MRSAVVRAFGRPLVIEDRPVPEPAPGQVVIRMEASGLCHTAVNEAIGEVLGGQAKARLVLQP